MSIRNTPSVRASRAKSSTSPTTAHSCGRPGIEGLVHVSEMSWTRRINHPSEMVNVGDQIEVVVLEIDKEKQEISLGMKQIETNPWLRVAEKYPANTVVSGKVRNLTNYALSWRLRKASTASCTCPT